MKERYVQALSFYSQQPNSENGQPPQVNAAHPTNNQQTNKQHHLEVTYFRSASNIFLRLLITHLLTMVRSQLVLVLVHIKVRHGIQTTRSDRGFVVCSSRLELRVK
mmetsp:Transcript_8459/g.19201  ORF Transcript_8459/g.19201 Transcript_8459/m.19201 type:complete len:106 (+) Transcript_8459:45-362(+)